MFTVLLKKKKKCSCCPLNFRLQPVFGGWKTEVFSVTVYVWKKKKNCVCVFFFSCLFYFSCRISHAIFKLASLEQGLTAAPWVIIREQAEGPFQISVLNNHTQDLTPNEMMRGSHRSCQISAACFALLWRLKPPCLACTHTNRNTHTGTHTLPACHCCPLNVEASVFWQMRNEWQESTAQLLLCAAVMSVRYDSPTMEINILEKRSFFLKGRGKRK